MIAPCTSSQNLSMEACLWNAIDAAMDRTWCALSLWDTRKGVGDTCSIRILWMI